MFFRRKAPPAKKKTRRGQRAPRRSQSHQRDDDTEPAHSVINISDHTLTPPQSNVLSRGLSFAPTKRVNAFKLKVDSYKFFRQLHLKHFFHSKSDVATGGTTEPLSKFKKKSTFMPPGAPNPTLATFSKLVEKDIEEVVKCKNRQKNYNISVLERKALNELRDNPKGLQVLRMNLKRLVTI